MDFLSNDFCGDAFWDDFFAIKNDSSFPVATKCFSHTVLVGVPCLFFWILLPVLILQLRHSRGPVLPWTTLRSMKWLVTTFLLADNFLLFLAAVYEKLFKPQAPPLIDYIYPICLCITFLTILFMKNECRRAGIRSSGVVYCTWLLFVIFGIQEFYAWITIGSDPQGGQTVADFNRNLLYMIYFPLLVINLFLHSFADPMNWFSTEEHRCPEENASFLNRQTMWWYGPIVKTGSKKPLEVDDLFELRKDQYIDYLFNIWTREWNHALREQVALPSIVGTLWKMFKWDLLGSTAIKFVCDILQYANPLFLSALITFTEDSSAPLWLGFVYAFGLFLAAELRSLTMSNYMADMIRVGTAIQTVLTTQVYEKTRRLSNAARRQKTHGEIVNLMAIDVDRFRMITPQLQQYWSSLMTIIITLVLLYQTVGYSVVTGIVVMEIINYADYAVENCTANNNYYMGMFYTLGLYESYRKHSSSLIYFFHYLDHKWVNVTV